MPDPRGASASSPGAAASVDLAAEQVYLERARAALAQMRERTLALQAEGGDALAGESLSRLLWLRAKALQDDPRTSPLLRPDRHRRQSGSRSEHADGR